MNDQPLTALDRAPPTFMLTPGERIEANTLSMKVVEAIEDRAFDRPQIVLLALLLAAATVMLQAWPTSKWETFKNTAMMLRNLLA
jgi:hypothetical protein